MKAKNTTARPPPAYQRRIHEHKWAKIIRFVPGAEIDNMLTTYDAEKNILRINRELYDLLSPSDQTKVWRLEENAVLEVHGSNGHDPHVVAQRRNPHKGGSI